MTPYEIKIILHYYTSPNDYIDNAPIRDETLKRFVSLGLLEPSDGKQDYKITQKGNLYIERLIITPFPVQQTIWVFPEIDN